MNNGDPISNTALLKKLRNTNRLLLEVAQDANFIRQAILMLMAAVSDLSQQSGAVKSRQYRQLLKAVNQLHGKSWKRQHKRLSALL